MQLLKRDGDGCLGSKIDLANLDNFQKAISNDFGKINFFFKCLYSLGSKWKSIQIAEIIEYSYYVTAKEIRSSFLLELMFGRFYNIVSTYVYMSRRVYKRTPPCLFCITLHTLVLEETLLYQS